MTNDTIEYEVIWADDPDTMTMNINMKVNDGWIVAPHQSMNVVAVTEQSPYGGTLQGTRYAILMQITRKAHGGV